MTTAATPRRKASLSTEEENAQLSLFRRDVAWACDQFGVIDDAQGLGGRGDGTMPFKPWPAQIRVLWQLAEHQRVIILKARQLGISWIVCWFVLWKCLTLPGQNWLLFSKGQNEANDLIRRIRALYDRMPGWIRFRLPTMIGPGSRSELAWANGSRVKSMPATKNAGISFTASGVVMDEAAHMLWAESLYVSVKPTVDAGGQLIILSTANGVGGLFHGIWDKAAHGLNTFKTVFLPWWARPGRTKAWYAQVVRDAKDPKLVPQEYPANAAEAFLASGRTRFEQAWITVQVQNSRPKLDARAYPADWWKAPDWPGPAEGRIPAPGTVPGLSVYGLPDPSRRYVVAADVAEGKETQGGGERDYCAAAIVDADSYEEMATIHGQWEPDAFATYLMSLGRAYNLAPLVVERNNHGHAVLVTLKLLGYPAIARGHDDAPGWHTNEKTKPQGIDLLAEMLRDDLIRVHHPATHLELSYYSVLKNGSTGAQPGYHDDLVMAWYLFLSWMRDRRRKVGGLPQAIGDGFALKNYLGR